LQVNEMWTRKENFVLYRETCQVVNDMIEE